MRRLRESEKPGRRTTRRTRSAQYSRHTGITRRFGARCRLDSKWSCIATLAGHRLLDPCGGSDGDPPSVDNASPTATAPKTSAGPDDIEREISAYLETVKIGETRCTARGKSTPTASVFAVHSALRRREFVEWLMNRYLSYRMVPIQDFQLLGFISLFIASKYNDLPHRALTLHAVLTLCRDEYTGGDIFEMERRVLQGAMGEAEEEARGSTALRGECVALRHLGNNQAGTATGMASPPSPPGNATGPLLLIESIPGPTLILAAHSSRWQASSQRRGQTQPSPPSSHDLHPAVRAPVGRADGRMLHRLPRIQRTRTRSAAIFTCRRQPTPPPEKAAWMEE
ncbi:hypothetical protein M427DRAFT_71962 [Gonapodya prolifera JEL478]|uniref:Cyclin N-terminal domain-containing protein n=1 Tax=Gonapodya prolifera (strain JEL478) TaxID=1344416 RepID=A0A139A6P4_GONPJ|nr:hypothetical protein M427DRAFT_71962 [Gonapodya prolifera JEL478]|eukprot:KXS12487.1 hypothetical protein M427DRAFT_71962 [Gonapodya prolifera JEL478]